MSKRIENPTSFEIRSVIKFLNAKNVRPAEICRQVCEVYGENVMSDGMVRRWCRMFSKGRSNVENDERSGRPSLVTDDLLEQVKSRIVENRRITMTELSKHFPQISRSLLHEVVREHLQFNKVCSRWVTSDENNSLGSPKSAKKEHSEPEEFVVIKSDKDHVYKYDKKNKTRKIAATEIKVERKEVDENQSTDAINQRLFDGNTPTSRTEDLSIQSNISEVNIKIECEDACVESAQDLSAPSIPKSVVSKANETQNMILADDIKIEYEEVDVRPTAQTSLLTSVAKVPRDQMEFNIAMSSEKSDEYNNLMYDYQVVETPGQRKQRLNRERVNRWRARQSQETLDRLRQKDLERHAVSRAYESQEARLARRKRNAASAARRRRARMLNSSQSTEDNNPSNEYEVLNLNLTPAKLTTTSWPFVDPDKMIDSSPLIQAPLNFGLKIDDLDNPTNDDDLRIKIEDIKEFL
ncbi:PREDICTED: uncharacterized protein LOC108563968 isoform X2 [Nicrophorus vespilloides]|uniref:Uncharacterized protein LOC108563968 isoform X2 n=1 Tax=Nicrophorus vespilloides TaxID=110193 RepID=A0ABM1MUQ5_NICVS|nr:PREDICTED: uncharacterized protein LOC108563968 isoform X2 [Nicrophorus vespilloides]